MAFSSSPNSSVPTSAKIIVAGGFGVGKTTAVGAISEIPPVNTDNWMTQIGEAVDSLADGDGKVRTTVAMDFGRITLSGNLVLYLFGTPGQVRFLPMWDDLCRGASGALVLVDTRRLDASFTAINYFDADSDVPFIVAVNLFDGRQTHSLEEIREALQLTERDIPDYIEVDPKAMSAKYIRTPELAEVPYPVKMEPNLVVEFYAS